jgi:hypothetical protein
MLGLRWRFSSPVRRGARQRREPRNADEINDVMDALVSGPDAQI